MGLRRINDSDKGRRVSAGSRDRRGELDCPVRAHVRAERHMDCKDSHNYDDLSELRKIAIALGARRAIAEIKP